jgi:hypothetical protein
MVRPATIDRIRSSVHADPWRRTVRAGSSLVSPIPSRKRFEEGKLKFRKPT